MRKQKFRRKNKLREKLRVQILAQGEIFDAMDEVQGPTDVIVEVSEVPTPVSDQQKEQTASRVEPSGPTGSLRDSDFLKLQAELDRIRAEKLQDELDHALQAFKKTIFYLLAIGSSVAAGVVSDKPFFYFEAGALS
ncbi:hypothetical protein Dimus_025179 [Dionaea muscipula]